jgi:hypothetical protein
VLDEGYLRRVYRTALFATLALSAAIGLILSSHAAFGLIAGSALEMFCMWLTERAVRKVLRPGVQSGRALVPYAVGGYSAVIAFVWGVTRCPAINLPAFAAGVGVPLVVMVILAMWRLWPRRTEKPDVSSSE